MLLYVDDVILGVPTYKDMVKPIKDNVDVEDQGKIEDYNDVNVT